LNVRVPWRHALIRDQLFLPESAILAIGAQSLMAIAAARTIAYEILQKVESGGYASDLLLLHCAGVDPRDAGLASEIVFGVLRYRAQLDFLIAHYSGRSRKLDREVRTVLRMAVYQLRYLERIPAHAAVKESGELVKRARKTSAVGFVNAVLRQVDRDPVAWPDRETELSCPEWLLARWERQFGVEAATAIARAALREPEKYVRIAAAGDRIQDIGSQTIVPLLGLQPGERFLDLCAAPGNKTAQALEAGVRTVACDLHFHRLTQMCPLTPNLVVLDGTRPLPFGVVFDRILVDAPCSGTGTLGRNPEIKWRLKPEDLDDLAHRQSALLTQALAVLVPGGTLVYSTCSLETEENEAVVQSALGLGAAQPLPHGRGSDGEVSWAPTHGRGSDAILGGPGSWAPVIDPSRDREGAVSCNPVELEVHPTGADLREQMQRLPGRDPGDGFYAAVIKST
jgi:16S rRNA (cytosine967-C5)-methyltransferase